jgi:glycosyltransferase involved in cell wall biosynthesis
MPSRWQEPFGIVGIEALTFGVPVAAWASGGIPEWHPGPGLVAWGDVPGLANALRALAGGGATPGAGFDEASLMARLEDAYTAARGAA